MAIGEHAGFDLEVGSSQASMIIEADEDIASTVAGVAVSTVKKFTGFSSDGGNRLSNLTLAAPTSGMTKFIKFKVRAHSGDTVDLTITNFNDATKITFGTAGQAVLLAGMAGYWCIMATYGSPVVS